MFKLSDGLCVLLILSVWLVCIILLRAWSKPNLVDTKTLIEPVYQIPKCHHCDQLMDCPTCGAGNFAPSLRGH